MSTLMPRQALLEVLRKEHEKTMKVLRAYPPEHTELRPHPRAKTAHELAWIFALECGLAQLIMQDHFASATPSGEPPPPPASWEELLAAVEQSYAQYLELVGSYTDEQMGERVTFFTAPHTMGKHTRAEIVWFLLFDQVHHRGQFSVYLRMADGKVPSIYGPSADEPWM
jgi:uncharacterized damage-inducible protein DinB